MNSNHDEQLRAVIHDTAACYRFVKATAVACRISANFPSYLPATRALLNYLKDLAAATQKFLEIFPSDEKVGPQQFSSHRQMLSLILAAWKKLHLYVRPAANADTLNVPTALIKLLTERVRLIEDCALSFAVIHTDQVNYFQFPSGEFEQAATYLGEVVVASLDFPADLGIIALPHSQAQNLFLNDLLAHEIGHFVFSRRKCIDRIEKNLKQGLDAAFPAPVDMELTPQQRGRLPGTLQDWAEELFCDLFGVYLLGPSFVFASIELFDLGSLWSPDAELNQEAAELHFTFNWSHPSPLFRMWRQVELLNSLGWWDAIAGTASHYVRIMDACLRLKQSSFAFDKVSEGVGSRIIDAFCRALSAIEREVAIVANQLLNRDGKPAEVQEFRMLNGSIGSYLEHGVVPSTLYLENDFTIPSPIVLLNAAHSFYLGGVENLVRNSDRPDTSNIIQRDIWMERVENWTKKALEDVSLVTKAGA